MFFSAFDKGANLDVLDHPILNFMYYLIVEIVPSSLVLIILRKLPPKRGTAHYHPIRWSHKWFQGKQTVSWSFANVHMPVHIIKDRGVELWNYTAVCLMVGMHFLLLFWPSWLEWKVLAIMVLKFAIVKWLCLVNKRVLCILLRSARACFSWS